MGLSTGRSFAFVFNYKAKNFKPVKLVVGLWRFLYIACILSTICFNLPPANECCKIAKQTKAQISGKNTKLKAKVNTFFKLVRIGLLKEFCKANA